jgi:hypothetical protein
MIVLLLVPPSLVEIRKKIRRRRMLFVVKEVKDEVNVNE